MPRIEVNLPYASWNGTLMPLAEVMVPALDRAFLFGDAIYEFVRLYDGEPFLLDAHEKRLNRSLHELAIDKRYEAGALAQDIARLVKAAGLGEGVFYLQVTRGAGPRKHVPPEGLKPNVLAFVDAFNESTTYYDGWVNGTTAAFVPDVRWGRCDVKSVNLLGNVLAASQAKEQRCEEAILIDEAGMITEGAHTSVFAVMDGVLVTRPLSSKLLPGVTRDFVLALANELGIAVREAAISKAALVGALPKRAEVFVTATSSEILPITTLDGMRVGEGRPGPVTRRLQKAFWAKLPRATQERRQPLFARF